MKKGLLITLAVILVLAAGGYGAYYYLTNKDVAPVEIGVADDFFDFDSLLDDSIAGSDTPLPSTKDDGKGSESGSGTVHVDPALSNPDSTTNSPDKDKPATDTTQSPDKKSDKDEPVTEDSLRAKYEPKFLTLEQTALSRLDTLKENAWAEYQANQAGDSSRSLVDISSVYMSAGNKLQSKVDNTFYSLLEKMKQELTDAKLSMELVNETEMHYHQTIRTKKSEIMGKVSEVMK